MRTQRAWCINGQSNKLMLISVRTSSDVVLMVNLISHQIFLWLWSQPIGFYVFCFGLLFLSMNDIQRWMNTSNILCGYCNFSCIWCFCVASFTYYFKSFIFVVFFFQLFYFDVYVAIYVFRLALNTIYFDVDIYNNKINTIINNISFSFNITTTKQYCLYKWR